MKRSHPGSWLGPIPSRWKAISLSSLVSTPLRTGCLSQKFSRLSTGKTFFFSDGSAHLELLPPKLRSLPVTIV
jgi:hypothetical protein